MNHMDTTERDYDFRIRKSEEGQSRINLNALAFEQAKNTAKDKSHKFGIFASTRQTDQTLVYKAICENCNKELYLEITEDENFVNGDCYGTAYHQPCTDSRKIRREELHNDTIEIKDTNTFRFKKGSGIWVSSYQEEALRIIAESMKKYHSHSFITKECTTKMSDFHVSNSTKPYEVFRTKCTICGKEVYFKLTPEEDEFISVYCYGNGYLSSCFETKSGPQYDGKKVTESFAEANQTAKRMGHDLEPFVLNTAGTRYESKCKKCGKKFDIIQLQSTNSTFSFSGEASWSSCISKPVKEDEEITVQDLEELEKYSKKVLKLVNYIRKIIEKKEVEEEIEPEELIGDLPEDVLEAETKGES